MRWKRVRHRMVRTGGGESVGWVERRGGRPGLGDRTYEELPVLRESSHLEGGNEFTFNGLEVGEQNSSSVW